MFVCYIYLCLLNVLKLLMFNGFAINTVEILVSLTKILTVNSSSPMTTIDYLVNFP